MGEASMRGSIPDEDASCAAAWAILADVRRDRFPDVGRKRKLVVITPLPTHREHTGPPIDIAQFQREDFARAESQTRQQQKQCIIPATDRSLAITSLDHPFHFLRLKVPRHFRQPPSRHGRKDSGEVPLGHSGLEEKPAERTQRRDHQLRHFGTAGTAVPQHEVGDIVGDELSKTDRASSKTFDQELSDEAPIAGDCSRAKSTFFPEIVFITSPQCCQR
jgi:hypothetical protein